MFGTILEITITADGSTAFITTGFGGGTWRCTVDAGAATLSGCVHDLVSPSNIYSIAVKGTSSVVTYRDLTNKYFLQYCKIKAAPVTTPPGPAKTIDASSCTAVAGAPSFSGATFAAISVS